MRTKEDWQVFRKQQKAIEENSLVEWAIEEDEDMDDFLFLELLVQCVSESLDGTLPHESVFHQCDKQSCYICFRSMGF